MPRILIVEDEENIRDVCQRYMERDGYEVITAVDGQEGWEKFQSLQPQLVVVDVMMPKKDGYQLCTEIRQVADTPLIMLTARGDERDRVMGLTLGADDYLTKPFSPRELMLRVQNILRRVLPRGEVADGQSNASKALIYEDISVDPVKRRVTVQNHVVELTVREFDVLYLMAKRPGQVFSKGQLLDLAWGLDSLTDTSAVTVLIRRLREKIEQDASHPTLIHTVWGIGYKFEPIHVRDGGRSE